MAFTVAWYGFIEFLGLAPPLGTIINIHSPPWTIHFSERDALSPHVSQFPRFHMSGQTTWQITYESLLGKMLRLRNSCLWICSVTNKQTWGTPDSDYISNSQERKSHTENKRKKKQKIGLIPPFTSPKTAYRANPDILFSCRGASYICVLFLFLFLAIFLVSVDISYAYLMRPDNLLWRVFANATDRRIN